MEHSTNIQFLQGKTHGCPIADSNLPRRTLCFPLITIIHPWIYCGFPHWRVACGLTRKRKPTRKSWQRMDVRPSREKLASVRVCSTSTIWLGFADGVARCCSDSGNDFVTLICLDEPFIGWFWALGVEISKWTTTWPGIYSTLPLGPAATVTLYQNGQRQVTTPIAMKEHPIPC